MKKKGTRTAILELIPSEMQNTIIEDDMPFATVLQIVSKCFQYSEGIEKLAYAVRQVEGQTNIPWDELYSFVRMHYAEITHYQDKIPRVISYIERKDLLAVASEIEWPEDILRDAYRKSTPDWSQDRLRESFHKDPNLLEAMVKDLAKMGQMNDSFPVLEFVVRLEVYACSQGQKDVSNKIHSWVENKASERGLYDQLAKLYDRVKPKETPLVKPRIEAKKTPHLLVEFYGDTANSEMNISPEKHTYGVRAWLFDDDDKIVDAVIREEMSGPLKAMVPAVGNLLGQCLSIEKVAGIISFDNLIIEFLVPDELLSHDFGSWEVAIGDDTFKLGAQYPIVVRSSQRVINVVKPQRKQNRDAWDDKTKKFEAMKEQDHATGFACICSAEECALKKETHLTGDSPYAVLFCGQGKDHGQDHLQAALRSTSIVCLALADSPPHSSTDASKAMPFFRMLRRTGMPIALWTRDCVDSPGLLALSQSYHPLSSLPKKVMQWRQNAVIAEEERAIGKHLTLLWDFPVRLPPDLTADYCQAPVIGG